MSDISGQNASRSGDATTDDANDNEDVQGRRASSSFTAESLDADDEAEESKNRSSGLPKPKEGGSGADTSLPHVTSTEREMDTQYCIPFSGARDGNSGRDPSPSFLSSEDEVSPIPPALYTETEKGKRPNSRSFSYYNSKQAIWDHLRPRRFHKSKPSAANGSFPDPSSRNASPTQSNRRVPSCREDRSTPISAPSRRANGVDSIDIDLQNKKFKSLLQGYGCCVFFFPYPVISWFFPFCGHVGITNAEGTVLYTFESQYYIREENVVEVLGEVLPQLQERPSHTSDGEHSLGEEAITSEEDYLSSSPTRKETNTITEGSSGYHSHHSSSGASPTSRVESSDPRFHTYPNRLHRDSLSASTRTPGHSTEYSLGGSGYESPQISESAPSTRNKGYTRSKGNYHAPCVKIWDLKASLMQRRFQRVDNTSDTFSAAADAPEGYNNFSFPEFKSKCRDPNGNDFKQLDLQTAQFYNKQLYRAAKTFRGTSMIQSVSNVTELGTTSFDFVSYVLEACGLVGDSTLAKALSNEWKTDSKEDESGISPQWGFLKVSFYIALRGEWLWSSRRLLRVLHGGSYLTSLMFLCGTVYAVYFYYPVWMGLFAGLCQYVYSFVDGSAVSNNNNNSTIHEVNATQDPQFLNPTSHDVSGDGVLSSKTRGGGFFFVDFLRFIYVFVSTLYLRIARKYLDLFVSVSTKVTEIVFSFYRSVHTQDNATFPPEKETIYS